MSYKSDWRATPRCVHAIVLFDETTLLRMRRRYLRAERWGLFAFADPLRPACKTSIFWLPHMSRRTIRARCNLNISNHSADVIRLASFRTKRVAVAGVDGVSVITIKGGGSPGPASLRTAGRCSRGLPASSSSSMALTS